MRMRRRVLSFLLAGVLTIGCLPMTVGAAVNTAYGNLSSHYGIQPADGTTENQPFPSDLLHEEHGAATTRVRIPALITSGDGYLVAACDMRWNSCGDGGGNDTIVTRSNDGGKTWNYTFANYLGDNGNVHNKNSSTTFIDPSLATDKESNTIYLACDLFPSAVSTNQGSGTIYPSKEGSTGYDEDNNLLLAKVTDSFSGVTDSAGERGNAENYTYSLKKNTEGSESVYSIYDASGNLVEGYMIDGKFNIKGTTEDTKSVDTNLFCGDSPYIPFPTSYIYIVKSTDNGKTWSDPVLVNVKDAAERAFLVGPGHGTVINYNGHKRIIFASYSFPTNNMFRSTTIYSDDDGQTWHRGEPVKESSSEAVITEADGRLYMFVRKANVYYTSTDGGVSWSDPVNMGINYWNECEVSAITYSKKINGQTAIIFSAPAGTTGRYNGKFWVALVQGDGSLKWINNGYEVTPANSFYAYSCLTETSDGEIGFVYEYQENLITFNKIDIKTLVGDAQVSGLYLTDEEGATVGTSLVLTPEQNKTYTLEGFGEDAEIEVQSSNPSVAEISVEGTTLKVTGHAVNSAAGYGQATVTVKAGNDTLVFDVMVTTSTNYKYVELPLGESVDFEDWTGDYSTTDTTGVENADVSLTGKTVVSSGRIGTGTGTFTDNTVAMHRFEYTFVGGTSGVVKSTHTNSNVNIYMVPGQTGNIPNSTSSATVLVEARDNGTFSFKNTSNNYYLAFANGKFDRTSSYASAYNDFELYTRATGTTQDSDIAGYKRIMDISELTPGISCLVAVDYNGEKYLLSASTNGTWYSNVAKVDNSLTDTSADEVGAVAGATGNGTFSDTWRKPLSECMYTFTETSGTWSVAATLKTTNRTTYLTAGPSRGTSPNASSTTGAVTGVTEVSEGKYCFSNASYKLYLHRENAANKYMFDRIGASNDAVSYPQCLFMLYEPTTEVQENAEIPGYKKVTGTPESGKSYLIVADMWTSAGAEGGVLCVLTPPADPSLLTTSQQAIAKVVKDEKFQSKKVTKITITAVKKGSSTVKIGDVDYYINVRGAEVSKDDISLEVTAPVKGQTLADAEKNKDSDKYTISSTVWTDSAGELADTASENSNYLAIIELAPTDTTEFTTNSIPTEITVNIDGTNTKTVPITYADLNSDGTMMVSYSFEDLFIGGGLRMDYADDYSKTCMRFGYDFTLPTGAVFEGCEWYYGTADDALTYTLQPEETKYIMNPENKGSDVYRSNIVFTNLGSMNYNKNVYARVLVKYTVNGKSYSKMGSFIDTRKVKEIAESIRDSADASKDQKTYAKGLLSEISE